MKNKNTKSERDALIDSVVNEEMTRRFVSQVGHKARVDRTDIENERMDALRSVLGDIGRDMIEVGAVPKGMEYMGSACVHIYRAPTLGEVAYVNQLNLSECPEVLAGPASSDLRGAMLTYYGRARQKKRSGF